MGTPFALHESAGTTPVAMVLCGFRFCSSLRTPASVTWISSYQAFLGIAKVIYFGLWLRGVVAMQG